MAKMTAFQADDKGSIPFQGSMPHVTRMFHHCFVTPVAQHQEECMQVVADEVNAWGGRITAMSIAQMPGDGIHMVVSAEKKI